MSSMALERLQTERKNWRKDHPKNFTAKPEAKKDGTTNLLLWHCKIPGKEGSAWEGGEYNLTLQFPSDFPMNPPIATFTPPLFHPNIFEGGQVCLSILKAQKDWAASITLKEILIGLQDLLAAPNPSDPANSRAAAQFLNEPQKYEKNVRALAIKFKPKDADDDE